MVPEINLLPKIEHGTSSKRLLFIVSGIIFALLLSIFNDSILDVVEKRNSLQSEEQMLTNEKTELQTTVDSLNVPKELDLAASVKFVESVSYPVSPLLIEINKYIKEDTYLRNYFFTEDTIEFSVDFETMADIATYVGDLSRKCLL